MVFSKISRRYTSIKIITTIILMLSWIIIVTGGFIKARLIKPKPMYSVISGFSTLNKRNIRQANAGIKDTYILKKNKRFTGTYYLKNNSSKAHDFLLLTFLDYRQIPISLNGKKKTSQPISVNANNEVNFRFMTQKLGAGFHNFLMILVWSYKNFTLQSEARLETDDSFYSAQRANILVGDKPSLELQILNIQGTVSPNRKNFDRVLINKKKISGSELWLKEKTKPGKLVNYYVHVGNTSDQPKKYILIALLDYKQIALEQEGVGTFIGKLGSKQKAAIPARFLAPKEKGVHELIVFAIFNPFSRQADKNSGIAGSVRVPIIVQ